MTLPWLLSWWNLLFIVPFALALMYLGLYTMSGITFGDADADGDFDADADADSEFHIEADADADAHVEGPDHDVHVEADHDAHVETDGDGDSDSDHDSESSQGFATAALQWLGVGRVPVSIILMVLLLTWGWIGFICNVVLLGHMGHGFAVAMVSVPAAFFGSLLITRCRGRTGGEMAADVRNDRAVGGISFWARWAKRSTTSIKNLE